jgi:hypothetical protein
MAAENTPDLGDVEADVTNVIPGRAKREPGIHKPCANEGH